MHFAGFVASADLNKGTVKPCTWQCCFKPYTELGSGSVQHFCSTDRCHQPETICISARCCVHVCGIVCCGCPKLYSCLFLYPRILFKCKSMCCLQPPCRVAGHHVIVCTSCAAIALPLQARHIAGDRTIIARRLAFCYASAVNVFARSHEDLVHKNADHCVCYAPRHCSFALPSQA